MNNHNGLHEMLTANAGGEVYSVAISPDRKMIVSGGLSGINIFGASLKFPICHTLESGLVAQQGANCN